MGTRNRWAQLSVGRRAGRALLETTLAGLEESDAGTTVHYQGESQLQGRVSRIGARLLTGVAKRLAAEFFKRLEREA